LKSLSKIQTLVAKDLLTERRTKEFFSATLIFSILVLVIFNFAIDTGREMALAVGPGVLWVAFSFSGTLGLNRAFAPENENGNLQALAMLPIDKGLIYISKMLSASMFMMLTELLIIPLFILFFNLSLWEEIPGLILVCVLGTLGFVGAGTTFSAVALNTKMREVILPLLLFPVTIPILIASVEATGTVLRGEGLTAAYDWMKILIAFDVIIVISSFLTFEYVLEE